MSASIATRNLFRITVLTLLFLGAAAAIFAQPTRLAGTTPVGTTAQAQAIVTLSGGGTIAAVKVLTQGTPASDFAATGGTCIPSASFLPTQTCTLTLTFTPTVPGERRGAIVLLDHNNTPLATQLLVAQATGSVATFLPGTINTIAGNQLWIYGGDGNLATVSSIFLPFGLAVDAAGNLFIADFSNNRIRRVDALTGIISTVAGTGVIGSTGDGGPATQAALSAPSSVALDPAGNLYLADSGNNVIRRIDAFTGLISTVAGTLNHHGYSGDLGPATAAILNTPNGIALDDLGNLYLADTGNHVIRKITPAGIITTIAGTGAASFSGDGGPAVSAGLSSPWSITPTPLGELYIADQNNHRIRKIDASGNMSTIAGTGAASFSGDAGPASAAGLNAPASVALDVAGNLYIADSGNNRIRKISSKTGFITTIAGNSGESISGDNGPADAAGLYGPYTLAVDSQGALLIADVFHNRIRKVSSNAAHLDFPPQRVGRISAVSLPEQLENDGNAPLNLLKLDPTSMSRLDSGNTTCALTTPLQILDQCTLSFQFMPTATGPNVLGTFTVQSDAGNSPSLVTLAGQVLDVDPSTVTLASGTNPSATGSPVTFSVTATSDGATPTGQLTLLDGSVAIATAQLMPGGLATFTVTNFTSGQHSMTVAYAGDASNSSAVSPILLQVVKDQQAATATTLVTAQSPTDAGAAIRLTAGVSAVTLNSGTGPITGRVSFKEGANTLGVVDITDGATAALTFASLPPGNHTILAAYSGSSNYAASTSPALTQIVQVATSRIALGTSANPGTAGLPLTLTATTLTSGGTATGVITFLDAGHPLGTITLDPTGIATLTAPGTNWTPGPHILTATYPGDINDAPANSPLFTETITFAPSTSSLTSSVNPSPLGGPVTLTANVAGSTPTGTITFVDGSIPLGTAPINPAGTATFLTSNLALGDHALSITYSGDPYNAASHSAAIKQTITPTDIAITLASSVNPALYGQHITFAINVKGSGQTPTGTVLLLDAGTTIATLTLDPSGNTSTTLANLAIAVHSLTAVYAGDSTHATITSQPLSQRVLQPTTLTLTGSTTQAIAATPIIFTLTLAGTQAKPVTGPLTLIEGSTTLATLPTSGPVTLTNLPVGPHTLTATYPGDDLDAPITSAPFAVTITMAQTTASLSTSQNPANAGSALTLNSVITSTGPNPSGSITFFDGTSPLATVNLTNLGASLTLSTLSPGIHHLTATYSGDPNNASATSSPVTQQITRHTVVTLTSSANPSLLTDAITLTLAAANGSTTIPPTGTITLTDGNATLATLPLTAGAATYTIPTPTLGLHTMLATYTGDSENAPAASQPLLETITLRPSTTTFTPSSTALSAGQQLILISVVQTAQAKASIAPPTGTVAFFSGAQRLGTAPINASGIATLTLTPASAGLLIATATYSGDQLYATSTSSIVNITVGPPVEFNLTVTPNTISLKSGDRTTLTLALTTAPTFADTLAFGCAGLPAYATCTFSENQVPVGGGLPHTLTVVLDTGNPLGSGTAAKNAGAPSFGPSPKDGFTKSTTPKPITFCMLPAILFLALFHPKKRPRPRPGKLLILSLLSLATLGSITGCGTTFTQNATPAGAYTFQIVATANKSTTTNTATIQLQVTK